MGTKHKAKGGNGNRLTPGKEETSGTRGRGRIKGGEGNQGKIRSKEPSLRRWGTYSGRGTQYTKRSGFGSLSKKRAWSVVQHPVREKA
ncbi:hypothetical protein K474DRAFT_1458758 [Panus rudis PR-1116 ss-1]|nr:hypothetical protein K474DRAFT_1458758 [Panus rudis PR-1116 ss-1]